jgi:DNA-binding NarL/FixJ family response regulator
VIRILLADDHNLVRAGLRALLQALPDVEVVAECADGREALTAIAMHRPDIAILDITMPGMNGLEAAARVTKEMPGTKVVIVSMHSAESYVAQALAAGVSGYVLKDAFVDELPLLVRTITRGETYLSPAISKQIVDGLRQRMAAGSSPTPSDTLTPRQREILQLLAEGKTAKEIAHLLGLSAKTVETHRAQIMDRLDIRDLPGLVRYAIRTGLVTSDT